MFGLAISALAALSFLGIGAGAAFAPKALSVNYGIPVDDPAGFAYIRALGARDAVLGAIVLALMATRDHEALAVTLGLGALVGAADFSVVCGERGLAARQSLAIHGAGTLGLIAAALLVRAGR